MRIVKLRVALLASIAAGLGLLVSAAPASAQFAPNTLATGVFGVIGSQGTGTATPRIGLVLGGGFGHFNRGRTIPLFSESLGIVSNGGILGTLSIATSGITTHVSSTGITSASGQAQAASTLGSLSITMSLTAAAPSDPPLLSLTATDINAQVTNTRTSPGVDAQTATATFGSLSLGGSLIGPTPKTFSGGAPGNYVLYADDQMTIILNAQQLTGVIGCTPTCQFQPKKITSQAILIEFFHKPISGKKDISGNVQVATDAVNLP